MKRVLSVAALVLLAFAPALPLQAAVFTVTKTADTLDGLCDDDCSLREAVSAANLNLGTDVIDLPAGIYLLSRVGAGEDANATGDLDVTDDLIVVGAGAGSSVLDGFSSDRVLDLGASTEIFGVTIRHGRVDGDGGGIRGRLFIGSIRIHRVVIAENQAQHGG